VNIPGQATLLSPQLQTQDGSFVGEVGVGPAPGTVTQYNMVAFDSSGNTKWSVPNDYPQIATADGGVIGYSGVTYDANGNATGQLGSLPTQSWTGNAYTDGPVQQVAFALPNLAASFWAIFGNLSFASLAWIPGTAITRRNAEAAKSHNSTTGWNMRDLPRRIHGLQRHRPRPQRA
jgi:hypothetical protein